MIREDPSRFNGFTAFLCEIFGVMRTNTNEVRKILQNQKDSKNINKDFSKKQGQMSIGENLNGLSKKRFMKGHLLTN